MRWHGNGFAAKLQRLPITFCSILKKQRTDTIVQSCAALNETPKASAIFLTALIVGFSFGAPRGN